MATRVRSDRACVDDPARTLRMAERRWAALIGTAPDGIIGLDRPGRITLFNPAAEAMFGYRADEVLGRPVTILLSLPPCGRHAGQLCACPGDSSAGVPPLTCRRTGEGRRRSGEPFPVEVFVSGARVGRVVTYTAIVRDISERLRIEADLQRLRLLAQQRERLADVGAITAKIVHDLGNPVAALSMQAELILRRVRRGMAADTVVAPAERILTATQRLDRLIREFMDFAREQRLVLETVRLAEFLAETVELWTPVAAGRGVDLALDAGHDIPAIMADPDKLRRVLDNLVKNAVEAAEGVGAGRVRVSAESPAPERVVISVEDNGPGIPEGVEIFRPFATTKSDGSGLGLAVARQIVLAHGGRIGFAPAHPRGTVFRVELPRHGPPS